MHRTPFSLPAALRRATAFLLVGLALSSASLLAQGQTGSLVGRVTAVDSGLTLAGAQATMAGTHLHPIYTGLLLAMVGSFLPVLALRHVLLLAYVRFILFLKIRIEESLRRRQFPQAYPEYARRTKALIPFLF